MNYTIHEMPLELRPRERLIKYGVQSLSDYELLAIILRTGTKGLSVLDLSKNIIIKEGNIGKFNEITLEELKKNPGIKEAKAIEILASIEFGKRVFNYNKKKTKIDSIVDAYNIVYTDMVNLSYEKTKIIFLDIKGFIIDIKTLSIGNINSSNLDIKEILKWSLKLSSLNIILVHNHPSGNPEPSRSDIEFTNLLKEKAMELEIFLIDHIIIGKNRFYSFEKGKVIDIVN